MRQNDTLTISEIEVMLDQFHDHVDRAIVNACRGRHNRAAAYLAAARRLVDVLPADVIDYFEMSCGLRDAGPERRHPSEASPFRSTIPGYTTSAIPGSTMKKIGGDFLFRSIEPPLRLLTTETSHFFHQNWNAESQGNEADRAYQ